MTAIERLKELCERATKGEFSADVLYHSELLRDTAREAIPALIELCEAQAALITAMTVVLEPPSYETAGLLTAPAAAVEAARGKLEKICDF